MLVGNLGYVALCSFLLSALTVRYGSMASRWLSNLRVYVVPEDDASASSSSSKSPQAANGQTRNRKKMKASEKEDEDYRELRDNMGNASYISVNPLPKSVVEATTYFSQWDIMVYFTVILLLNFVLGEAGAAMGLSTNNFTIPMGIMMLGTVTYTLVQTELTAKEIPSFMKLGTAVTALVNFIGALLVLRLTPPGILDFSINETSKEFMPTLISFLRSKNPAFQAMHGEAIDPTVPSIAIALIASLQGALLFAPAHRCARMYYKAVTPPPSWGKDFMQFSFLAKALLHFTLIAPVVTIVVWVKPLAEMWGLKPGGSQELAQSICLILTGATSALCLRPLLQSYLNLALQFWYDHKHGVKPSDRDTVKHAKEIARVIRRKIHHNQQLLVKVAIQVFSLGALCLAYGIVLFCGAVNTPADAQLALPVSFWRAVSGFLGWWSCVAWFTYVGLVLVMHRIGVITS